MLKNEHDKLVKAIELNTLVAATSILVTLAGIAVAIFSIII